MARIRSGQAPQKFVFPRVNAETGAPELWLSGDAGEEQVPDRDGHLDFLTDEAGGVFNLTDHDRFQWFHATRPRAGEAADAQGAGNVSLIILRAICTEIFEMARDDMGPVGGTRIRVFIWHRPEGSDKPFAIMVDEMSPVPIPSISGSE